MKTLESILKHWLPVFLWAGLIYWLSSRPSLASGFTGQSDFILRKSAHIGEYAVLAFLWFRALTSAGLSRRKALLYSTLFGISFAISDEIHQLYVPGREGRVRDVLIDTIGVIGVAGFIDVLKIGGRR